MYTATTFEAAARSRKVAALVEYFDRHVSELGSHPFRDAGAIASVLREASASQWTAHARLAERHPPSTITIAAIVGVYERRATSLK